ncbi:uncharacterized protein [Ptychodera flava]|uniref:uncharacterized protein n=1 Tax=Ptychodera flava TaxID=63121 RepID=UPI00396A6364
MYISFRDLFVSKRVSTATMTGGRIFTCAAFMVLFAVTSYGHVESDGSSLPGVIDFARDAMIQNIYYKQDGPNVLEETATPPTDDGLTTTQELVIYSSIAYLGLTLWAFCCLLYVVWAAGHTKMARDEMEEIK